MTRALSATTSDNSKSEERLCSSSPPPPPPPRPPPLIDVDCNLLHPDLISLLSNDDDDERAAAPDDEPPLRILRHPSTADSGVVAALSPSSTIDESERGVDLLLRSGGAAREDDGDDATVEVRTTVGVHPYHAAEVGPPTAPSLDRLRDLLRADRDRAAARSSSATTAGADDDGPAPAGAPRRRLVVAVGETGLDYTNGFPPREVQVPWFEAQLDLAYEFDLPLFVHERGAFEDLCRLVDEAAERHRDLVGEGGGGGRTAPPPPIIVHCFTGTPDQCRRYIERGWHVSISGYVNKGKPGDGSDPDEVRRCLREGLIPLDRLMIETDSPYMGFASGRDAFLDIELAEGGKFGTLSGKKKKQLRKSTYPNVPSSLPLVLRGVVDALNEGRVERGGAEEEAKGKRGAEKGAGGGETERLLDVGQVARITTENAANFFGFRCPKIFR